MLPVTTLQKLSRLRRRERGLRLVWGCARTLAVLALALLLCCLTDWIIDRWFDTPMLLRFGFLLFQGALALAALGYLILRPQWEWLSDSRLALWVEDKLPRFRERLITAVELNRKGAQTSGMSGELIDGVTREAEDESRRTDFTQVADTRRLSWSGLVLAPVVLIAVGLLLLFPTTVTALLARQLLADRAIPRSMALEHGTGKIFPSGDPVTVQFHVTSQGPALGRDVAGTVRLWADDGFVSTYNLEWRDKAKDGEPNYEARLPAMWTSFHFSARVGDGRTREPGRVTYEPRPATLKQQAWVILPAYCGLRPDGQRYEQFMDKGDLHLFSSSAARVVAELNKPVARATLEVLGVNREGADQINRSLEMTLLADATKAEITFEPQAGDTAYRLVLHDRHGFESKNLPRRSIIIQPDEPPLVMLLPERFARPGQRTGLDDTEVEGIPVPVGGPFWVAYRCRTPTRLNKANFRYRVIAPGTEVKPDEPAWRSLPLTEWKASTEAGPFDLTLGTFEKLSFFDEIEFHPVPSEDPENVPGRHDGGGRFAFKTGALQKLAAGDKIEFYVEVQDSRPTPLVGRSEVRVKDVVEEKQLALWLQQKREEMRRLQQLEARQSGLFDPAGSDRSAP